MTPVLAADRITVGHARGRDVLVDATLALPSGGRVALLGANGAGKSTLLRTLAGVLTPRAGTVRYNGRPLEAGRGALREHRRHVQLVLQDPDDQLFNADVFQDVSYGPTNLNLPIAEVRARVAEAVALMGVDHLTQRPIHRLSYGERKRVATAGAVAMRPEVLLLDEPTAGLDPRGVDDVRAALERLHANGTSIVVATHDVDFAYGWADTAAVVHAGQVTAGAPHVIFADAELLAAAQLRAPWPVAVAHRLGLPAPETDDDLLARLEQLTEVSDPDAS